MPRLRAFTHIGTIGEREREANSYCSYYQVLSIEKAISCPQFPKKSGVVCMQITGRCVCAVAAAFRTTSNDVHPNTQHGLWHMRHRLENHAYSRWEKQYRLPLSPKPRIFKVRKRRPTLASPPTHPPTSPLSFDTFQPCRRWVRLHFRTGKIFRRFYHRPETAES